MLSTQSCKLQYSLYIIFKYLLFSLHILYPFVYVCVYQMVYKRYFKYVLIIFKNIIFLSCKLTEHLTELSFQTCYTICLYHLIHSKCYSYIYMHTHTYTCKWYFCPFFHISGLIQFSQPVLVRREDPDSRINTIKEIQKRSTSGGKWPQIFIFPEGTCTNRSCLIRFKLGMSVCSNCLNWVCQTLHV